MERREPQAIVLADDIGLGMTIISTVFILLSGPNTTIKPRTAGDIITSASLSATLNIYI